MKPVTYFIQDSTIDTLVERFGCYLEQLDRPQKLQLRVLLTNFLMGQEMMGSDYTICDAWEDSSLHLLVEDETVVEFADILEHLTIAQSEGLLQALQEQCTIGNARIKTPVEIASETFIGLGVPEQLAITAATILKQVDGLRDRTPDEQSTINQIHQCMTANIRQQRQAEATS